ncbi:hypothetical protein BC937DRAFT_95224 [Endogone sp. FLAS-F59071]|nr:hypothetical protein BC937DRAFT_95224 [Endogone sp. FLAS-F59071]|eukprot:RUS22903.1 hypothetical protein BC937DRAFT_95224 [Endogone sp. FLAS-F59071]
MDETEQIRTVVTDKSIRTIKHVLLGPSDDRGLETPKQKKVRITLDNDENDGEDFKENGSQGDSSDDEITPADPLNNPFLKSLESPPIDWEFDAEMPTWLPKMINRYRSLTSETDKMKRFHSASKQVLDKSCVLLILVPLWWRIVGVSEPKLVPDILLENEFLELNNMFSSALNVGCKKQLDRA